VSDSGWQGTAAGRRPERLQIILVAEIDARDANLRSWRNPKQFADLVASVCERGVIQPIRVRRRASRYQIITGERRWLAALRAGLREIPAVVVDTVDDDGVLDFLIENIHREDLTVADRSAALRQLRVALGLHSWEEVARVVGLSRVHVHRLLSINGLPVKMRESARLAGLNEKHVRALVLARQDPATQWELWRRIQDEGLSGEEALRVARGSPTRPPSAREGRPGEPQSILTAADELLDMLVKASQRDVDSARPILNDLRQWLGEVLDHRQDRRLPAQSGGDAELDAAQWASGGSAERLNATAIALQRSVTTAAEARSAGASPMASDSHPIRIAGAPTPR